MSARLWTATELRMLGRMPDSKVAERVGLSAVSVWRKRQAYEIAPYRSRPMKAVPPEWWRDLGTMPDSQLAGIVGVTPQRIQQLRKERGIAAFRKYTRQGVIHNNIRRDDHV